MLCEVERKKCHLDPLTRPSLMPDVISLWEKIVCFLLWFPFFTNFILMGCFEVGTVDLMLLIEDLMLLMIILRTLPWQKVNFPWLKVTFHAPRMWDVVHVSFLHSKSPSLKIAWSRQSVISWWYAKWKRLTVIGSNDFHETFCWI